MATGKKKKGDHAEQLAWQFLHTQGMRLETRNYRTRWGEVDIVAWDGNVLVFAEVRLRAPSHFGSGAESITPDKRRKIGAAAEHFLQTHFQSLTPDCRFDVISIDGSLEKHDIHWIKNAFQRT